MSRASAILHIHEEEGRARLVEFMKEHADRWTESWEGRPFNPWDYFMAHARFFDDVQVPPRRRGERRRSSQCWSNAASASIRNRGLAYCEGAIFYRAPIRHAWNWDKTQQQGRDYTLLQSDNTLYYGAVIPDLWVALAVNASHWTVMGGVIESMISLRDADLIRCKEAID